MVIDPVTECFEHVMEAALGIHVVGVGAPTGIRVGVVVFVDVVEIDAPGGPVTARSRAATITNPHIGIQRRRWSVRVRR